MSHYQGSKKQETPKAQAKAIIGSLLGDNDNMMDQVGADDSRIFRMLEQANQLLTLGKDYIAPSHLEEICVIIEKSIIQNLLNFQNKQIRRQAACNLIKENLSGLQILFQIYCSNDWKLINA